MTENKSFFAGLEEVIARLAALLITLLFFIVFMLARSNPLNLDWLGIVQVLIVFWFMYELVGIILFQFFKFFSGRSVPPVIAPPSPEATSIPATTTMDIEEGSE